MTRIGSACCGWWSRRGPWERRRVVKVDFKRGQQLAIDDLSGRCCFGDTHRRSTTGIRKIVERNRNAPSVRNYTP